MSNAEGAIVRLKLIEALRSPTPTKLKQVSGTYNISKVPDLLLTAAQISSLATFKELLTVYRQLGRDINEQDSNGNTALHIAVGLGRIELVKALLSEPGINDTVSNNKDEQPLEVAPTEDIANFVVSARNAFIQQVAVTMKEAFKLQDIDRLEAIYANPRVPELVNINGMDPDTGTTVLHDAAAAGNSRLVEFILNHGGDPLLRSKKGKLPAEVAHGDSVKRQLHQAAQAKSILSEANASVTSPPKMTGFLKKWTNITSGYKKRWFVLEDGVLKYYKHPEDLEARVTVDMSTARVKLLSSESSRFEVRSPSAKFHVKAAHPSEASRWVWTLQNSISVAKESKESRRSRVSTKSGSHARTNTASSVVSNAASNLAPSDLELTRKASNTGSQLSLTATDGVMPMFINDLNASANDDFDPDEDLTDLEDDSALFSSPTTAEALKLQIDTLKDLFTFLLSHSGSELEINDALQTGKSNTLLLASDFDSYISFEANRAAHFQAKLKQSENNQRIWAQTVRDLTIAQEKLEGQVYAYRQEQQAASEPNFAPEGSSQGHDDSDDDVFYDSVEQWASESGADEAKHTSEYAAQQDSADMQDASASEPTPVSAKHSSTKLPKPDTDVETSEFTANQEEVHNAIVADKSFNGYEDPPRDKLKIDDDNRPKISLWGVLKSLIGKDMTRMTLPVSFNECTNLLQRSCEDMEYTDLLDKAAASVDDEGLRMAYVAAFAGSSYSSTIDRIAKPFNPILGETFEYCRPDKEFRLVCEQVSHHPPVGALLAQSPRWDFYGDSNVKSAFYGRSFDFNPTGLWYINLRPNRGANVDEELYSFRKLTSSVVGIIVGRPVVDNFGTMVITNHATGTVAEIEYKARGWRGASAFKLEGVVKDKDGTQLYEIGGAWNDKIYAKSCTQKRPGKLVLWQIHERPSRPFNLTPFAITLNALPDNLRPWLPPTDTRFRPDQRSMEEGRYDDAAVEKNQVEEKQRAARRQREEEGKIYKPRWFELQTHPVTGKEYYKPLNVAEYWRLRSQQALKDEGDLF